MRWRWTCNSEKVVVLVLIQEWFVYEGAGGDDTNDSTLERGLLTWLMEGELFAHGDETFVMKYEDLDIFVKVHQGKATHRDILLVPDARSQLDA